MMMPTTATEAIAKDADDGHGDGDGDARCGVQRCARCVWWHPRTSPQPEPPTPPHLRPPRPPPTPPPPHHHPHPPHVTWEHTDANM
eukprot:8686790-Alexandrium_andersonii.AAC.1